jgi:GR25 family glycosyltransferase involved in LPS biosynthesis
MQKIDRIYLINMERSTDRLQHFMNEVEKHKLPVEKIQIFKAIDASKHEFTPEELELTSNINSEIKTVICNFLSHYYVWKDVKEKSYKNVLVLQDDVYFVNDFMEKIDKVVEKIPDDAILVNVGTHFVGINSIFIDWPINEPYERTYCKEIVNEQICIWNRAAFSLAYILNSAELSFLNGIDSAIDCFTEKKLIEQNIYYGSMDILATGNSKFKSTIFVGPTATEYLSSYLEMMEME